MLYNQLTKIQQMAADQFMCNELGEYGFKKDNHFYTKAQADSGCSNDGDKVKKESVTVYYCQIGNDVKVGCDEDNVIDFLPESSLVDMVWDNIQKFKLEYYSVSHR